MLYLDEEDVSNSSAPSWLSIYWYEFRRRVLHLFGFEFAKFPPEMALSILQLKNDTVAKQSKRQSNSFKVMQSFSSRALD